MIINKTYRSDMNGIQGKFKVVTYIGSDALKWEGREDVKNWIKESLGKVVESHQGKKGLVIGFEDNEVFADYYLIIYLPSENKLSYELVVTILPDDKQI